MLVPVVRRAERGVALGPVSLPFSTNLSRLFSIVARARSSARRGDVDEPHVESRLREDLGDAVAHRARANHSHTFDVQHA